eukprot:7603829-Karenia_brevis.AAC.1
MVVPSKLVQSRNRFQAGPRASCPTGVSCPSESDSIGHRIVDTSTIGSNSHLLDRPSASAGDRSPGAPG